MRRIGATCAREGMVMGWPIYDSDGRLILDVGDEMDAESLTRISESGIGELIVEDNRVYDVPVEPLVPPAEEAMLIHNVRQITTRLREGNSLHPENLAQMVQHVHGMIRTMSNSLLGEPSSAGCLNVESYDHVHPARVAGLSLILGLEYGIKDSDLVALGLAALLMNVGYVKLPEDALMTRGPLSPAVWQDLAQHPVIGAKIISAIDSVDGKVIRAIAESHERFDGTGYPNGIKGEEISLIARVLGMVDTFYALVSTRPYRKPFLPHEAIEFVMAYSMELFDPDLVELFSRKVPLYATGIGVKLSSNETGVVADANLGHIGRPIVRILVDRLGAEIKSPYELDLSAPDQQRELVVQVLDF